MRRKQVNFLERLRRVFNLSDSQTRSTSAGIDPLPKADDQNMTTGETPQASHSDRSLRTVQGRFRPGNALSQREAILACLTAGEELISVEAAARFGCQRLGARIYDLRRDGYGIGTRRIRHTDGKQYTCYFLSGKAGA